jgi:hypothetical protein
MAKLIRLAAGVCCLGILALGVVAFDPACLPTFPPRRGPDDRASMADEVARGERLNELNAALQRLRQVKRRVAAEVIAGRRSLAEAVEQFLAMDRDWPDFGPPPLWTAQVGMSEDEGAGRAVLYFVQLVLADRPDEAAAVGDLLEKELQQLLAERTKRPPAPVEPRTERNR